MTAFTAGRMYVVFMWDPRVILFIYVYVFSCAPYETQAINDRCVCVSSFFFFFSWLLLCMRTWTTFGSCQRHKWCPTNTSFFFLFNIPVAACFSAVLYSIISPFIHYRSAADQLCTWHTHTHTRARMDKREKTPFFPFLVVFVSRGQGILHLLFTLKEKKKKTEASFLMRVAKPLKRKPLHSYVLYYSHVRLSLMISLYCILFICLFFFFFYGHHFLFSSDQLPGGKSKSATSFSTHKVKEHAQSQFVEHPNTVSVLWLLHWEYKLKRGKKNVCMHGSRNSGGYYCKIWLLVLTKWTLKPKRWV